MTCYRVTYRTPTAHHGTAVVDADGIHATQDAARRAVHILSGHPPEDITILAVAAYPSGPTLWWDPEHYTPTSEEAAHA